MTYVDEIRRQAEAAPRAALSAVTAALWRAFGEGQVTEAEAEALSALIEKRREARKTPPSLEGPADRQNGARTGVGSRPRTNLSLERRRRWAASGRLPPGIAARFTLAEQAVLALVAAETTRRGDCRLAVGHLAALVGVAETTVRNAIREARKLGLLTVEERRLTGFRNDTNVVRVVSPEWMAWLRLARAGDRPSAGKGGGCRSPKGTPTQVPNPGKTVATAPSQICREAESQPGRRPARFVAGRVGR